MQSSSKRILVILGHPDADSLSGAMAQRYIEGAQSSGAEVRLLKLGELRFDPILKLGYKEIQTLEPDLQEARKLITWAEHLVFVYPIWWGALPALLKGFIDRTFLPGFAFKYRKNSVWWDRLLKGRSARLITLMDTPPFYYRWFYRCPGHHQMKRTILEFCGITPVRISSFGPVRSADEPERQKWLNTVHALGLKQI